MQTRGEQALANIPHELRKLPRTIVPLATGGIQGAIALRALGTDEEFAKDEARSEQPEYEFPIGLGELIDDIEAPGRGVILTMGKGGVGKTTVAAAIAVALAERGHRVHLSTTDPAAHVATALADGSLPNISVETHRSCAMKQPVIRRR